MNKMLIAVFDSEAATNLGLQALHKLHAQGDITLYASGVMIKDAGGVITVKTPLHEEPVGTVIGLAVGSTIGLLGGPVGLAVGALTGTVVGAVRDFWVAGVGLDFIEEAGTFLHPGKVALVAEIEEEWVLPVDTALDAAGGRIFRRNRSEMNQAWLDQDVTAFKSEIGALESEASTATGEAKLKLQSKLAAAKVRLDDAVHRAKQRVDTLKREAEAKAMALKVQWERSEDRVRMPTSLDHPFHFHMNTHSSSSWSGAPTSWSGAPAHEQAAPLWSPFLLHTRASQRPSHGLAFQIDPVCLMNYAVKNCVSHRWIGKHGVPLLGRVLARNQQRSCAHPSIHDVK